MTRLGSGSERILRACLATIRPHGSGFDLEIDEDVLAGVDTMLPSLPRNLRLLLPVGLRLLEWGPALFAHPRRLARMSRLPPEQALAYLEGWQQAGGLRGGLLLGVRTLLYLCFYQHPQVLESLGVDWQGRAAELTSRRARLYSGGAG